MDTISKNLEVTRLFSEVSSNLKQALSKSFENAGFTMPQGMAIGMLARFGKMKVTELGERLNLSNSTVSGILDRLEKQGMVKRTRSEEDRRIVYVDLTSKFEELHRDFHKKMEEKLAEIMESATPEDLDKIIAGLNTLKKLLRDKQQYF